MTRINLSIIILLTVGCSTTDQNQAINQAGGLLNQILSGNSKALSKNEIGEGLKQALLKGVSKGTSELSKAGSFLNNPELRIYLPEKARKVEKKLNKIGLTKLTKKVNVTLNQAAEQAMTEALPIFSQAITKMSFSDAMNILQGPEDSATTYLRKTTYQTLFNKFRPRVSDSLANVDALKYWGEFSSQYNALPFVKPINSDIKSYVTEKAIDGLFSSIKKEEANIRKNPQARTTDLLKRVFSK